MLSLAVCPAVEPISIAEAKRQLLITPTSTESDPEIARWIVSARMRAQRVSRRALITQTWDLVLDEFPSCGYLILPKPPLQSVTSVTYRDSAGVSQVWGASGNYLVEAPTGDFAAPGRLSLATGVPWPALYGQAGAVTVRFVCGYGGADAVPALLKEGMLLDVATRSAQRENIVTGTIVAKVPGTADEIYKSFRVWAVQRRAA